MKPIEPGCEAIIIGALLPHNRPNIGKRVRVIERVRPGMIFTAASGNHARAKANDSNTGLSWDNMKGWVVERPTADLLWKFNGCINPNDLFARVAIAEHRLMRLDDPDLLIDETHDTELPINA